MDEVETQHIDIKWDYENEVYRCPCGEGFDPYNSDHELDTIDMDINLQYHFNTIDHDKYWRKTES